MKKANQPSFILELKLSALVWQQQILKTRFELARRLYNTTLSYALKQVQCMKESKRYRKQLYVYREIKAKMKRTTNKNLIPFYQKELDTYTQNLNEIRQSFELSEFGLHAYMKKHQHNYKKHIDSNTAQKIASKVWQSIEDVLFKGSKAHFKKYGTMTSVEGKTNKSGIRFRDNNIHWNGLEIPVRIRKNDLFAEEVLSCHKIKYSRIVKKAIRGKDAYYVQLIMEGIPPSKRVNSTGAFRHPKMPHGRVGIDMGTSTVAVASDKEVWIQPLAPKVPQLDKEKRRLLRKLDRSRRSNHSDNFNADGTVKKGIKLTWERSNHYMKTLYQLKEVYRKQSAYVKAEHGKIANRILSCGDEVYVEKMNFRALTKRAKETKINVKGKYQRKKRFGKSIGSYAPALLITIIDRKLKYQHTEVHRVNTNTFKASQYNHITDSYKKKKLHQRWTTIGNHLVQRDLYSAFLLMNSETNLQQTNRESCNQTFHPFLALHNQQIEALKKMKEQLPSSIGIKKVS
ncbi:hypothetical protein JMM81_22320 [Bacillus sp. V3B]|nr:hypothetical protein [Bacillus sp. V3B]